MKAFRDAVEFGWPPAPRKLLMLRWFLAIFAGFGEARAVVSSLASSFETHRFAMLLRMRGENMRNHPAARRARGLRCVSRL
jgi:hypothetical protein